jgi:hypothetical protein
MRVLAAGPPNQTAVMEHRPLTRLEAGLDLVRAAPADAGTVELIVRRPAVGEREEVAEGTFDPVDGLVGDCWRVRGSSSTPDGSANPEAQVTLMAARVIDLLTGDRSRWRLAGDQVFVDLDLGETNLPPGTRLALGTATLEITAKPHTGCAKFRARFGPDALRFVSSPVGRELRLRGVNARVVSGGTFRRGDSVRKV